MSFKRIVLIAAAFAVALCAQQQGTVTVTVDKAETRIQIVVPVQVVSVSCPATITPISSGGAPANCLIALSQPAPTGGFRVTTLIAGCNPAGSCTSSPVIDPGVIVVPAGVSVFQFKVTLP